MYDIFVIEKEVEFKYEPGFAISQFHKSVRNLHAAIKLREGEKRILEVSTKSEEPLGITLSAFNLHYKETSYRLENVFQSSKVFVQNGTRKGPYRELLRNRVPKHEFTVEEMQELANNPNTSYVSRHVIRFTLEFRSIFLENTKQGSIQ